MNPDKIGARC